MRDYFNKIKKLFKKRRYVYVAVGILILLFIVWRINGNKQNKSSYQTAQVTRGNIIATISESGNVTADSQVNVSSTTDGIIEEVYVKNGDAVSAGDNLFKVRSTATAVQKTSAYASYLSAQNSFNSAQAQLNSLQSALFKANQAFLNDKGIPNPSDADKADPKYIEENADWLQAEANYKNQQGIISQAQASLNSAGLNYQATQDSIVTAPVSGIVANFSASVGSNVSASSSNTSSGSSSTSSSSSSPSGNAVLVLGNFSNLQVDVQASEVDIPNIHAGQKATITLDALPNLTFVGTVSSVNNIGTTTSGVVTYNVRVNFISPPSTIKPGMSASAVIQTAIHNNVLYAPTAAVQTINGQSYVRVINNGKVTQTPVEKGISSDSDTEITSGLSEGDTIVTSIITTTSANGQSSSPFSGTRGFGGGGGGGNRVIFRGN